MRRFAVQDQEAMDGGNETIEKHKDMEEDMDRKPAAKDLSQNPSPQTQLVTTASHPEPSLPAQASRTRQLAVNPSTEEASIASSKPWHVFDGWVSSRMAHPGLT